MNDFTTFLRETALHYFLKYVQIDTQSDTESNTYPTSANQFDLGRVIVKDFHDIGILNAELDANCYVYANLPASPNVDAAPLSFIAHLDTSPSASGKGVKPLLRKNYQGETLTYPDNDKLSLTPEECPALLKFIGGDIITASGKTLLGADDKAGIAAIMAACALIHHNPHLPHPELRICFTPDEEVGKGVDNIDLTRLGKIAYTLDGGELGELEAECFDAWSARLTFHGRNVHPGSAKNIMLNAAAIAARFVANIPEWQAPEHTENKEGFYHLGSINGDETRADISFIIRDFDKKLNEKRVEYLRQQILLFELKYPGLVIEMTANHSYQNMYHILSRHPQTIEKAASAIAACGVTVLHNAIRGGTDGARLCYMGLPTPNIFGGGLMFHSAQEWIPVIALQKAAEVVVKLAEYYA